MARAWTHDLPQNRGEHANHYTTDGLDTLIKIWRFKMVKYKEKQTIYNLWPDFK